VSEWVNAGKNTLGPDLFSDYTIKCESYEYKYMCETVPILFGDRLIGHVRYGKIIGFGGFDPSLAVLALGSSEIGFPGGRTVVDLNVVDGTIYISSELPYGDGVTGRSEIDVPQYRARLYRLVTTGAELKWEYVAPGYSVAE
jgi:hypothetical protein